MSSIVKTGFHKDTDSCLCCVSSTSLLHSPIVPGIQLYTQQALTMFWLLGKKMQKIGQENKETWIQSVRT